MRFLLSITLLFFLMTNVEANQRIALVIGNSTYTAGFLKNPVNDATDIANTLEQLDFDEVILLKNASRKTMLRALQRFRKKLNSQTEVAFFYYAGHGAQFEGQSYMLPLQADISSTADLPIEAMRAQDVLTQMRSSGSKVNVIVLDACRDLPFPQLQRGGSRGLARIDVASSALVAYSTNPGNTAADGQGRNSPYTLQLLKYLPKSNLTLTQLFNDVGVAVSQNTGGTQTPWMSSSPMPRVYLAKQAKPLSEQGQPPSGKEQISFDTEDREQNKPSTPNVPPVVTPPVAQQRQAFEPKMVAIPAGSFQMGCVSGKDCSDYEKPVHKVTLNAFELASTEVTFAQWDSCVKAKGCSHKPKDRGWGRSNRPVINVSWNDTQQYIQWLNKETGKRYRLPTEAEWEYAARAGTATAYSWGNQASHEKANYGKDSCCSGLAKGRDQWVYTAPVASFTANPWGLYDMHGNVWEWVQDKWHSNYQQAPTNGSAWNAGDGSYRVLRGGSSQHTFGYLRSTGHVLRGGSWNDAPRGLRSANRFRYSSGYRSLNLGFRLARSSAK